MKPVSHLALAALAVALAPTSALAKKEQPAAAAATGPKFDLSKEFRTAATPVQTAITAKDFAAAAAALPAATAAATKPDEKYIAGQFRYQIATGQNDKPGQTAGLKAMLASGAVSPNQLALINTQLGQDAYFAHDYNGSVGYLTAAIAAGEKAPDVYIMAADSEYRLKQYSQGVAFAQQGIALQEADGKTASLDFYTRAYSGALNSKDEALATKTGIALVRHYPTKENWRSLVGSYRDTHKLDPQITLDLYRLMRLTKGIAGERDYYDYAGLALERGLPGEAKAVVAEGFASGSAPKTSRPLTEIATAASQKVSADLAGLPAAATRAKGAASGRSAMATADAYLGYGEDAKAAELYRVALAKGTEVDSNAANMRLGIALARSGDKAGARTAFNQVQGARAPLAQYWLLFLDTGPAAAA